MASPTAFTDSLHFVLREEGVRWDDHGNITATGYVDDPRDPGGETNWGISKAAYPAEDIKNMSFERASQLYRAIWDHWGCEQLPDAWALFLFDAAVQHSPSIVTRFKFHNALAEAFWDRMRYYLSLKSLFSTYGRGWMTRMADLRDVIVSYGVPL